MEPLPSLKILVVEDDELQRAACVAFLEALGQQPLVAADGEEAVQLFSAHTPDLILMDVLLPKMDGFESTRRIRALCGMQWVPIIYLTVLDGSANLVEGLEAGGDDYLVKPMNVDILEAKLRSTIRTLSLHRQIETSRNQLANANTMLTLVNKELDTFAHSVAHDLKAPLRAINGYRSILAQDYASVLPPDALNLLERIGAGAMQMNALIDDILEYSRIERVAPNLTTCDLSRLIDNALDSLHTKAHGLKVQIERKDTAVSIQADCHGLELALRNLIDNALKFCCKADSPQIVLGFERTAENQHLWVRDNGIGFDPQYRERIFDIFQRLHPEDIYPGTGVGLAIVRKAMQRMGGHAWAESTPGSGATFHLEWPA